MIEKELTELESDFFRLKEQYQDGLITIGEFYNFLSQTVHHSKALLVQKHATVLQELGIPVPAEENHQLVDNPTLEILKLAYNGEKKIKAIKALRMCSMIKYGVTGDLRSCKDVVEVLIAEGKLI